MELSKRWKNLRAVHGDGFFECDPCRLRDEHSRTTDRREEIGAHPRECRLDLFLPYHGVSAPLKFSCRLTPQFSGRSHVRPSKVSPSSKTRHFTSVSRFRDARRK